MKVKESIQKLQALNLPEIEVRVLTSEGYEQSVKYVTEDVEENNCVFLESEEE